jgi:nitroimidazol reductase NimA-like FMN-containing flavoprotein (pyridoxamine 5'-phosphate oxidase superfamily)
MNSSPVLTRSVRTFLNAPRIARLSTVGADGYPHVVPIYFMRHRDEIVFGSDNGEQKVCNALRNRKGAVVIGGEPGKDDAGYLIQGDLTVESDPDHDLVKKLLYRYETKKEADGHLAEWMGGDMVLIRLKPKRVIRVW